MNFSGDRNVGILYAYLSIEFELDRSAKNGDLLSDRNHRKHRHIVRQTHTHTVKWACLVEGFNTLVTTGGLNLPDILVDPDCWLRSGFESTWF